MPPSPRPGSGPLEGPGTSGPLRPALDVQPRPGKPLSHSISDPTSSSHASRASAGESDSQASRAELQLTRLQTANKEAAGAASAARNSHPAPRYLSLQGRAGSALDEGQPVLWPGSPDRTASWIPLTRCCLSGQRGRGVTAGPQSRDPARPAAAFTCITPAPTRRYSSRCR